MDTGMMVEMPWEASESIVRQSLKKDLMITTAESDAELYAALLVVYDYYGGNLDDNTQ